MYRIIQVCLIIVKQFLIGLKMMVQYYFFSLQLPSLFAVDIKHSRKCIYFLLFLQQNRRSFFMCQGMTRSACAFDALWTYIIWGDFVRIRFFSSFFVYSYDPNIGRTMTSFSMLLISKSHIVSATLAFSKPAT